MKLELYYYESCPFCVKVLRYISEIKHNILLKNIQENKSFKEELLKTTEKALVPCLFIDGTPMLESDDIIEYLKKNLEFRI